MSEHQTKPTLRFAIFATPMIAANFSLEDGSNPLVASLIELCGNAQQAMIDKLQVLAEMYCEANGVEFEIIPNEEMAKGVIAALQQGGPDVSSVSGKIDKETGEFKFEPDYKCKGTA